MAPLSKKSNLPTVLWAIFAYLLISVSKNHFHLSALYGLEIGSAEYWHVRDSFDYLAWWFVGGLTIAVWVPVSAAPVKYLGVCLSLSLLIDFVDLQAHGDTRLNYFDVALWFIGVPYSIGSYLVFSRAKSDPIEPGGVYVIQNAPRDFMQLVAAFTIGKGFGAVAVYYDGGYYFPSNDSGRFERHEMPRLKLRPGQVAKKIKMDSECFTLWWGSVQGVQWSLWKNCFWAVRKLRG